LFFDILTHSPVRNQSRLELWRLGEGADNIPEMKVVMSMTISLVVAAGAFGQSCVDDVKEPIPTISIETRQRYEAELAEAQANDQKLNNAESKIWVARRIAYLGSYKESVYLYTLYISKSEAAGERNPRLYRHRGHRYITLRCFDDAVRDLETAARLIKGKPDEIEPDGIPNAKNIPTSTLQSNIWYHLGLAYYLKGDFKNAERSYREAWKVSKNNDMRVATAYWHYMTLRRMGNTKEAAKVLEPFAGEIEVIENDDYLKLIKLNRGERKAEELLSSISGDANSLGSASLAYGLGNYYLYNGDRKKAIETFQKITAGSQWASFGYIAAEAELRRARQKR
jgi:tetratricopeptide (TPR) repeat protein